MSHSVYKPFVQSALLPNVHCNELLVWFTASDFWYTIIIGSSQKLLWNILRPSRLMEILLVLSTGPVPSCAQQGLEGVDVSVTNPRLGCGPILINLVPPAPGEGVESVSLSSCQGQYSLVYGEGWGYFSQVQKPALPVKIWASSLGGVYSERQGQQSVGPAQHDPLILSHMIPKPSEMTPATDINTDPNCS